MSGDVETLLRTSRIRDLPRRPVRCVEPSLSLQDALRILADARTVALLVVEDEELVGIFTERDVLERTALEGDPEAPISRYMSVVEATATPDDLVADAIHRMHERHFRHLPLIDPQGGPPGLIGGRDVLKLLATQFPEALLNLPPRLHQRMPRPEGG